MNLPSLTARRGVRQFVKFGIVGATGALVNYILYSLLLFVHSQHWLAYAVGFIVGGVNNYWWNRLWTFRSRGHAGKELAQFVTVSAVALGISEIVLHIALRFLPPLMPLRNSTAWLTATIAGMGWNFFVNKYWTFRHTHFAQEPLDVEQPLDAKPPLDAQPPLDPQRPVVPGS